MVVDNVGMLYTNKIKKNIIIENIKQNSIHIKYLSDELKNNKKIILTAVKQNGLILQFVIDKFKNDKKIVLAAVKQNPLACSFMNKEFFKDPIVILTSLTQNIEILFIFKNLINYKIFGNIDYEKNKKLIFKVIKIFPGLYKYLNINIKKNIQITKDIIKINGFSLYFCLPKIKNNIDIVLTALNSNKKSVKTFTSIIDTIPVNMHKKKIIALKIIDIYGVKDLYKKSKLKFLHIGFSELNNIFSKDYIEYKFINIDLYTVNIIIKEFEYFLNTTENIDTVIFIELDKNIFSRYTINLENNKNINKHIIDNRIKIDTFYKNLNIYIYNLKQKYENVKIINIMDTNALVNSNKFYKVVNIYINNISKKIAKLYFYFTYNIKNCVYKKIELLTDDMLFNNILATHWLNTLINTPKVFENRLIQTSSTCWANSVFNSLYLIKDIREELYIKYEEYKKTKSGQFPIKFKNLRNPKYVKNIKDILFSIIGNLKNNIKPNKNNSNYVLVLSAYMKEYLDDLRNYPFHYYKFKKYKLKYKPYYSLCSASNNNKLRNKLCSNKKYRYDLTKLNQICSYNEPDTICDKYSKTSDQTYGYIYGDYGPLYSYLIVFDILEIIFNIKISAFVPTTLINTNILIILIGKKSISISSGDLIIDGNTYELRSCHLSNKNHTICGIKDRGIYYIFDSNDLWIEEDWSKLLNHKNLNSDKNLMKYREKFNGLFPYDKLDDKFYPEYLIYVLK